MSESVRFFVPGIPRPGGSKKGFIVKGHVVLADAGGEKNKNWRACVSLAARQAWLGKLPLTGPLHLRIQFHMPRPKYHFRSGKYAGTLKPNAPYWHVIDPDTTKIIRSTEDAMTGIIWVDDCQVCNQSIVKTYAADSAGADIEVTTL